MTVSVLAPGDVVGGQYRVVRPLRQAGPTDLFEVEPIAGGKTHVLQRVPPWAPSPEVFGKEARVWARAAAWAGLALVDEGVDGGAAWLVWERPDGDTLAERVARDGPLPFGQARPWLVQLGDAIAKLHAEGVVHRDVRPDGVVLGQPVSLGGPPRVRLAGHVLVDRLVGISLDMVTRSAVDEWSWCAPELMDGKARITPAADVWSFALVAFFALTGNRYWKADTTATLAREIMLDPLPPASARAAELGFGGDLPHGFDAWFAACVQRDGGARPDITTATRTFFGLWEMPAVQPILANPKGAHYDDGLQDPPPSQPGGSEGPYRGGRHGRERPHHDDHIVLANPKGSFYDRGLAREPRRWPAVIAVLFLIAGAVVAALRVFRR